MQQFCFPAERKILSHLCCVWKQVPLSVYRWLMRSCFQHSLVECWCECNTWGRKGLRSCSVLLFPPVIHLESVSHSSSPIGLQPVSGATMSLSLAVGIILCSPDNCNNPYCLLWNILAVLPMTIQVQNIWKHSKTPHVPKCLQIMLYFNGTATVVL